jgi:hypothetical protein
MRHPAGFSIIVPERMKAVMDDASDAGPARITIIPDGGHARYTYNVGVELLGSNVDLTEWKRNQTWLENTFQNQSALVETHAFGEYSIWEAMFVRNGRSFRLSLLIPDGGASVEKMPPAESLQYLESFRAE